MSDNELTFDDWLNHKIIDINKIDRELSDYVGPNLPFHAVYTTRYLREDFIASRIISEEVLKRIQEAQQHAADLLLNHWKNDAEAHVEKFIKTSGGNKAAINTELNQLENDLASLVEYHKNIPTFEYIGDDDTIATTNKFSVLVDPDLYRQLLSDVEDGKGIRPYLTYPEESPVDTGHEAIAGKYYKKIMADRERLTSQSYHLPEISIDSPGFNFPQMIEDQRHAIDYTLSYQSINHQIQLLTDHYEAIGEMSTVSSGRGSQSHLDKIEPVDAFYEEAKKIYQEGRVACFTKDGNPSSNLVNILESKGIAGYKMRDKEKSTKKRLNFKVIKQRLIENPDRWRVDK